LEKGVGERWGHATRSGAIFFWRLTVKYLGSEKKIDRGLR